MIQLRLRLRLQLLLQLVVVGGGITAVATAAVADTPPLQVIAQAARKVVKLYGAGGLRSLEGYQSGILVSPDGVILTAASTVLDSEQIDCVLDDDASRDGATYENVPVTVRHTAKVAPAANSSYLITSLENVRPIYRRILELTPRRLLVPLIN